MTPGEDLPGDASRLLAQAVLRDDTPQTVVIPDREAVERVLGSPRTVRALVPGDRSAYVACIPLVLDGAPPVVLGVAEVWRRSDHPFRDSELFDLQELVARTAHHVDLARQHQREHTQVLALQPAAAPRGRRHHRDRQRLPARDPRQRGCRRRLGEQLPAAGRPHRAGRR